MDGFFTFPFSCNFYRMPDFQIVPKSLCISGPRNWLHYHYRTSLSPCRNFNR
ncbi:hypothetical protein CDL12_16118 [Handroanthus impetiginosus]|uniref:Uncharacterized protein n=1 Tax=Handroanthus impetiginosus TaxID=429701 RepID=A0A2G9H1A9_9LAMI|nr:hypothetical protein CDL12_16118 [Handroanthus impetiginosus]